LGLWWNGIHGVFKRLCPLVAYGFDSRQAHETKEAPQRR
jgi:hypothetical protein